MQLDGQIAGGEEKKGYPQTPRKAVNYILLERSWNKEVRDYVSFPSIFVP